MNSLSNKDCGKHDCHRNHPRPGGALLRANSGSFGTSTFVFLATTLTQTVNQPIASVTIDTSCLDCPTTLIDFAGILTSRVIAPTSLTFNFTLFRTCRDTGVRIPVRTFTFSQQVAIPATPDSRTLKFEHSQCDDSCDECCTYSLDLTSISSTVATTVDVSINGTLSALAVESGC